MAVADIAAVAVKQEKDDSETGIQSNPVNLEERILELCKEHSKGVTDEMIISDQPMIDNVKRMKALQRLLSMGKIDLLKQGSTLIYRLKTSSAPGKTKGFEKEEKLVYQIIEDNGNRGIWIRDIRMKSNLPNLQVSKVLRTLESKKLIKSVKSVAAPRKKVYMLFDLVPDETLTGGAWYSDQEFETEFVDILNLKCLQYLQQKAHKSRTQHSTSPAIQRRTSYVTVNEVCKFITDLGISKVKLTSDNIQSILNTLVYDGKADVTTEIGSDDDVIKKYRASSSMIQSPGLSCVPCGVCPIIDQCSDTGAITPATCLYMKEWLTF